MSLPFLQNYLGLSSGLQTIQASSSSGSIGGWKELGRTTLGVGGTTITVSSLANKRYYMILNSGEHVSENNTRIRFNSDSGANYADRYSSNGGADGTEINTTHGLLEVNITGTTMLQTAYISNYSTKEKLLMSHTVRHGAAGAGTAPQRSEQVAKWANTTNAISSISVINEGGNFATGAECVVLGYDPADTHTTNFWEELASINASGSSTNLSSGTITAKKYLWIQVYCKSHTGNINMTFNNDTTAKYARRYSSNGAGDATNSSQNNISNMIGGGDAKPCFANIFIINNSANEKLIIGNSVSQNTAGAGNAPTRIEMVAKWENTSAQITEIDIDSTVTNFSSASMIKVWGSN